MSDMEEAARTRVRDALAHASGLREARIRHDAGAAQLGLLAGAMV